MWCTLRLNPRITAFYNVLSTSLLDPIMFADDTNLFYSHEDIKELFRVVNSELEKVCDWFNAKKNSD